MSTPENGVLDPYAAVLADLRAKRDQIDQAILTIEAVAGGLGSIKPSPAQRTDPVVGGADVGALAVNQPGAFLGMSISDAAKKLLLSQRRALSNTEIANAIQVGGLAMNSADPINTVGSVLTRRFNQVGDIVKVGRGIWGLKEWYPNRSFKPSRGAVASNATPSSGGSNEPEQPSEQIDDDPLVTASQREMGHPLDRPTVHG